MRTLRMEKRREARISAAMPLYFKNGKGVTDDLAIMGVFFWTDCPDDFAVGDHINFTIVVVEPGRTVLSDCSGEVVRVLERHRPKGVAVKLFRPALSRFVE